MVTNDIFISFLHCKRKAFLRAAGTPGRAADIETVLLDLGRVYRRQALDGFLARYREQNVVHDPPCLEAALKTRPQVIVNANVAADGLSSLIQAAERVEGTGQRSASAYGPVLFILNEVVTRADKLLLAFNALALSSVQGVLPPIGKIVHGSSHREMKVKIEPLLGEVRKLVVQIQAAQAEGAVPRVNLNRHCSACEFRDGCRKTAEETDDLSLLRGLSEKEIVKLRSRGITTVTQFSHCYRPGKRGKRKTGKARKHDPALQALAVREKKVYVLDSPEVPHSSVALYLDVEGIPDRNFYYLIGLVVVRDGACTEYAFWADDQSQEKANWNTCARVIEESGDYTLYHYGSYEQHFLDRMAKAGDEAAAAVERIRARSCNVLAAIYSHIYFPTLSNGLKDIGTILGARWSTTNASGIQSLVWRLAWEVEKEDSLKQQLLAYNREDCLALRRVTEFMLSVCAGATSRDEGPTVASAQDIPRREGYHFGKVDFFYPELAQINKCAYSDYQREKVYLRTSPEIRKSFQRKQRAGKRRLKVNEEVKCERPEVCPECGGTRAYVFSRRVNQKVISDLKFTPSGVKRWIIRYSSLRYQCGDCKKTFFSEGYYTARHRWGTNLSSWAIYHHVALRQSYDDVTLSLHDLFGFIFHNTILNRITLQAAKRYKETYDRMKDKLRRGPLIHADETKVTLKNSAGYVWAFTNMEEVVYAYTPTREGDILEDMLDGFTGVLVSDFYAAYDSAKCPQQKCLIHLMRDINDDLFHSPFDEELKQLAQRLVAVLKPIIDTIDKFGLAHRHLNKHKDDVARFFRYLTAQEYELEIARKCQKRILKYQDKLFVFLDHDGVPWNNNNAENAIKRFVSRRRIIGATSSERGLRDYLMFLSIYQACRRKHLSFLHFLRSGKLDLDVFADEAGR